MRKTILTALVVLLVMLAVSCDNIPTRQNDDGLVTLNVNTGGATGSRSIDDALAKAESQYIEVIFKHTVATTTTYHRAEGYRNRTLKVSIPQGTYETGTTSDAIVLIGNKLDGTLLAIGTLTDSPLTVNEGTFEVKFTATSLLVNIAAETDGSSSFKITDLGDDDKGFAADFSDTYTGSYSGNPCFQVPSGSNGIKATLTFGGSFPASGANIKVVDGSALTPDPVTPITFTKIIGPGPAIAIPTASITPAVDSTFAAIPAGGGGTPPAVPAGQIGLTFNTGARGIYFVTFKIPVVGFTAYDTGTSLPAGLANQLTWFVRAGTDSSSSFELPENDSLVLLVKDNSTMTEVEIKAPY